MIYAWTLTLTQKSWNISMEQIEAAPIGSSSCGCDIHLTDERLKATFQKIAHIVNRGQSWHLRDWAIWLD